VPQGISALLALNYQADLRTNARIMAEAAQTIKTIEITTAIRSVQINGVAVRKGEVIGLIDGKLRVKGQDPGPVITEALEEVGAQDYEIITVYYGETVTNGEAEAVAEEISNLYPDQEIEVIDGGQPHYHYILSVE
jgi:dihydroxyacetone kinase-like predicted kinase